MNPAPIPSPPPIHPEVNEAVIAYLQELKRWYVQHADYHRARWTPEIGAKAAEENVRHWSDIAHGIFIAATMLAPPPDPTA